MSIAIVTIPIISLPPSNICFCKGDKKFRQYGVVCSPEVCTHEIGDDDECLILASDGVWDVMSSQQAVDIVTRCEGTAEDKAKVLVERAFNPPRNSSDNITVVVAMLQ